MRYLTTICSRNKKVFYINRSLRVYHLKNNIYSFEKTMSIITRCWTSYRALSVKGETATKFESRHTHTRIYVYSSLSRQNSERNYESKSLMVVIPAVCSLINRRIITPRTSSKSSCERARDVSQLSCRRHKSIYAVSSAGARCSLRLTHVHRRLRDHLRQRTRRSLIGSSCACARTLREYARTICATRNERLAHCKLYCELRIFVLLAFECRDKAEGRETHPGENFDSIAGWQ